MFDSVVEHGALDHFLEGADVKPETQGLLWLRPLPGLALNCFELAIELLADFGDRHRRATDPTVEGDTSAADVGQFGAAPVGPEHVADAPEGEADD